jgi:hypothetical protein
MAFNGYGMSVDSRATQVFGSLQSGTAFQNPLSGAFGQTSSLIGSIGSTIATQLSLGILDSDTHGRILGILGQVQSGVLQPGSTSGAPSFFQHTQDAIGDLPNRMSMARSAINTNETMAPSLDPCAFINSVFGSILDIGAALMSDLIDGLSRLLAGLLNPVLEVINEILDTIMGAIEAIVSQVLDEIGNLLNASGLLDLFGQALNILNLLGDPCSAIVLGAASTDNFKDITGVF